MTCWHPTVVDFQPREGASAGASPGESRLSAPSSSRWLPDADTPSVCPSCQHAGPLQRHATRHSWWRDVPQGERPQYRRGHIVRWRCPACRSTHALVPDWAVPGKRMTRALDDWLTQALAQGWSARATALRCGLDAKTVRTWLRERGVTLP